MSDTTNEHVAAIKSAIEAGFEPTGDWEYISVENQEAILHHADALARQLAEATARYADAVVADERYFTLSSASPPDVLVNASGGYRNIEAVRRLIHDLSLIRDGQRHVYRRVVFIIPVDLDAAPGDTAGEE